MLILESGGMNMIYTDRTRRAMMLAYKAHQGQVDKAGVPYVFHPIHLAEQMKDEVTCCAALLHDTVEDTGVRLEQIYEAFGKDVGDVVAHLTHDKSVPYMDYIKEVKKDPRAVQVKLADLHHNMDIHRYDGLDLSEEEKKRIEMRLKQKYEPALKYLLA